MFSDSVGSIINIFYFWDKIGIGRHCMNILILNELDRVLDELVGIGFQNRNKRGLFRLVSAIVAEAIKSRSREFVVLRFV